jgi:hypothetical protein
MNEDVCVKSTEGGSADEPYDVVARTASGMHAVDRRIIFRI